MERTTKEEIMETLAYCWVLGWYAGTDGAKTDDGKKAAAKEQLDLLLKRLGLKSQNA